MSNPTTPSIPSGMGNVEHVRAAWHREFVKFVRDTTDATHQEAVAVLGRVIDMRENSSQCAFGRGYNVGYEEGRQRFATQLKDLQSQIAALDQMLAEQREQVINAETAYGQLLCSLSNMLRCRPDEEECLQKIALALSSQRKAE